ncbi:MAG: gluconate 2-dehydrogenase subunit 3 family protein [Chitinophagales bacterium]
MDRRHLLKGIGAIALYSSFPAVLGEFLSSCNSNTKNQRAGFFSDEEFSLIEQITDNMLPTTSTPGALDVQVPYFIDLVVKSCMNKNDQQLIKDGLQQFNKDTAGKFLSLSPEERAGIITKIDEAAFKDDESNPWFRIIKKLAVIGYFTSKEGMTKALNYVKVPGDYNACIPYKKGDKALAKTFLMYW